MIPLIPLLIGGGLIALAVITISKLTDENGEELNEAKNVQQKVWIYTNQDVLVGDILRK